MSELETRRARRIRDRERMQARAECLAKLFHFEAPASLPAADRPQWYSLATWKDVLKARRDWGRRMRDNLANCSCWMCGNPRRYFKDRTRQELRAFLDAKEQLAELRQ